MTTRNGRKQAENVKKKNVFGFDFVHEINSTNPRKNTNSNNVRILKNNLTSTPDVSCAKRAFRSKMQQIISPMLGSHQIC